MVGPCLKFMKIRLKRTEFRTPCGFKEIYMKILKFDGSCVWNGLKFGTTYIQVSSFTYEIMKIFKLEGHEFE